MYDTHLMRTSEVEVNKKLTMMVNDREHKAFKLRCMREDRSVSEVLRTFMRDYVKAAKRK